MHSQLEKRVVHKKVQTAFNSLSYPHSLSCSLFLFLLIWISPWLVYARMPRVSTTVKERKKKGLEEHHQPPLQGYRFFWIGKEKTSARYKEEIKKPRLVTVPGIKWRKKPPETSQILGVVAAQKNPLPFPRKCVGSIFFSFCFAFRCLLRFFFLLPMIDGLMDWWIDWLIVKNQNS